MAKGQRAKSLVHRLGKRGNQRRGKIRLRSEDSEKSPRKIPMDWLHRLTEKVVTGPEGMRVRVTSIPAVWGHIKEAHELGQSGPTVEQIKARRGN